MPATASFPTPARDGAIHRRHRSGSWQRAVLIAGLLLFSSVARQMTAAETWHVDATAATGGDGSSGAPFATIQAAADRAEAGDSVLIRSGTYRESVRPANSGNASDGPITFQAADGETVTISGAEALDGGWSSSGAGAGIYQRSISGQFDSRLHQAEQLLVDGRMMIRARWPDPVVDQLNPFQTAEQRIDGYEDLGDSPDRSGWRRLRLLDARLTDAAGTWDGAEIFLTPRHGHGDSAIDQGGGWGFTRSGVVIEQNVGSLIIDFPGTNLSHLDQYHMLDGYEPYHLEGTLPMLDQPGEWLRLGDTIYCKPPAGVDLNSVAVAIKRRDYAFDCSDRSHIHIRDIAVVAATITTDHDSGNHGTPGPNVTWRGRRDIAAAEHIVLQNIHFRYVNHFTDFTAWSEGQWVQTSGVVISGQHHVMRDCLIEYAAGNGILVIGENHLIDNNIVANINYTGCFAAGICSGMESPNRDSRITRNTVYNTGFDGITSQKLRSSDPQDPARVDHNLVSNFGLLCRDVGGVKAVGKDDGRINGTRWDHNQVRDGGPWSMGIYQDYAQGFVSDHNLVWDVQVGSNLNDCLDHQVFNNTYMGYRSGIDGIWTITNTTIVNNIVSNQLDIDTLNDSTVANNIVRAGNDLFVDAAMADFRLAEGSAARDAGQPISGVTPPGDDSPDCGAFQSGAAAWGAGSDRPLPIAPPTGLTARRQNDRSIRLAWSDPSGGAAPLIIERCTRMSPDNFWRRFDAVAELPPGSSSWTDSSAAARFHRPLYRVRVGDSMLSNTSGPQPINLVFHLDFEGDLADSSAVMGTTAVVPDGESAPTLVTDAYRGEQAARFDKDATQALQHDDHPALNPGDGLTIMLWMKPDYWPGGNRVVLRKGPSDIPSYALGIHSSSLRFQVGQWNSVSFTPPAEDRWSHVALTFNGQTMRAYIDGAEVAASERTWRRVSGIPITSEPLTIGGPGAGASSSSRYDGILDDLRIYNGPALTAEQIVAAYEGDLVQGPPLPPPDGNAAPTISSFTADPSPVTGTTTSLRVTASDPDDDELAYTWKLTTKPAGAPDPQIDGANDRATITFGAIGDYSFRATVDDGAASDNASLTITVTATATTVQVDPD